MSATLSWDAPRFLSSPPPGFSQNPRWKVAANQDGHLELFAIGSDGAVWHTWQTTPNSIVWSEWASLGSPASAAFLSNAEQMFAVQNADGRVELFITDAEWNVWHIWQAAANANWVSQWSSLGHPKNPNSSNDLFVPAVIVDDGGCLLVLMQDEADGAGTVYSRSQVAPNGNWTDQWVSLGTPPAIFADYVAAPVDRAPFTRVYVQSETLQPGAVATVYMSEKSSFVEGASQWSGWSPAFTTPPGPLGLSVSQARNNQDKHLELFALDTAKDDLWHTWQQSDQAVWTSEWDNLHHAQTTGVNAFDAALDLNGCLNVVSWQNDGFLYTIGQTAPNNGWGVWERIQTFNTSGFFAAEIKVIAQLNGLLSVFSRLTGNQFFYIRQLLEHE